MPRPSVRLCCRATARLPPACLAKAAAASPAAAPPAASAAAATKAAVCSVTCGGCVRARGAQALGDGYARCFLGVAMQIRDAGKEGQQCLRSVLPCACMSTAVLSSTQACCSQAAFCGSTRSSYRRMGLPMVAMAAMALIAPPSLSRTHLVQADEVTHGCAGGSGTRWAAPARAKEVGRQLAARHAVRGHEGRLQPASVGGGRGQGWEEKGSRGSGLRKYKWRGGDAGHFGRGSWDFDAKRSMRACEQREQPSTAPIPYRPMCSPKGGRVPQRLCLPQPHVKCLRWCVMCQGMGAHSHGKQEERSTREERSTERAGAPGPPAPPMH